MCVIIMGTHFGEGNVSAQLTHAAMLYANQWRKPDIQEEDLYLPPREFHILSSSPTFEGYYDEVQDLLKAMAGMDELLQGIHP